jgi:hypothetical protein
MRFDTAGQWVPADPSQYHLEMARLQQGEGGDVQFALRNSGDRTQEPTYVTVNQVIALATGLRSGQFDNLIPGISQRIKSAAS